MRRLALLGPSILAAIALTLGFWAGRYSVFREQGGWISAVRESESLGSIADQLEGRDGIAQAFLDPERARREMDGYLFAPPQVPAPFVGFAPRPERSDPRIGAPQLRASRELALPKPPRVFRIFLTGGSTAFGSGAPGAETTIGGLLEALLNQRPEAEASLRYEVFAAADPGWSSTHERIFVENRISEWQPDLVVALSGTNDVHFGALGFDVLWFRSYTDELYWKLLDSVHRASGSGPLRDPTARAATRVPADEVARRLHKNVRLGARAIRDAGGRSVFVLQPCLPVSSKPANARELRIRADLPRGAPRYFAAAYAAIRRGFAGSETSELGFLDYSDLFADRPRDEEIFLDSYHFGDRGNRMIAERLARDLLRWIPDRSTAAGAP